jgi:putative flippase GtrA
MKELIIAAAKYIFFGILATVVILAVFALFLSMPDILDWLSGYIGKEFTWILFFGAIAGFIAWCVAE